MALLLLAGFGMMQGLTASNTIIQTLVDEKMRGRVMSYYTMAFVGMAPFGSLLAGTLAHLIGTPRTVIVSGLACILGGLWFWTRLPGLRKDMRPIYERMGIIPQASIPEAPIMEEDAEN
jgi:MFS family permease